MATLLAEEFISAIDEGLDFIPIHISSLRLDSLTGFDLYLQVRPEEPAVLYAEHNVVFSETALRRLEENQIECLYINANQVDQYRRYLEDNLREIVSDPSIHISDRTDILHLSAQGLVKEILEDPGLEKGVERSKEIIQSTVTFILTQRSALRQLIQAASVDYFTYTHSVNGAVYAIALAQRAGYSDEPILRDFGSGMLLRDVGMSQIDKSISESRGKLNRTQFEIIKQHPILGEEMLREQGGLSNLALGVVRHHHEKLDGSGYPDGIRGRKINNLVRIASITDIFDALTTKRPYRRARKTYDALRLMHDDMGKELDPDLLRVFIDVMGNPG